MRCLHALIRIKLRQILLPAPLMSIPLVELCSPWLRWLSHTPLGGRRAPVCDVAQRVGTLGQSSTKERRYIGPRTARSSAAIGAWDGLPVVGAMRLRFLDFDHLGGDALVQSRFIAVLICLMLTACGAVAPPPDTAQLPQGAFGTTDNDMAAANQASWAFASAARTRDNPVDAARAVAAVDFLAGQLSSSPRWNSVSSLTKQQMLQTRADLRQTLGIVPNAPSQAVVSALLQFASAWRSGNQPAALQALANPAFTQPPQQTLQILSNLPSIPSANLATSSALRDMSRAIGSGRP